MDHNNKISIESILKYIGIMVPISFLLSCIFLMGKLDNYGIKFNQIPLTVYDISKQSFILIPVLLIYLSSNSLGLIKNFKSAHEYYERDGKRSFYSFISYIGLHIVICVIICILFYTLENQYISTVSLPYITYIVAKIYLYADDNYTSKMWFKINAFVNILGISLLSIYTIGYFSSDLYGRYEKLAIIKYSNLNIENVKVVDSFEEGILISYKDSYSFITWNNIESIKFLNARNKNLAICKFTNLLPYTLSACNRVNTEF